MLKMGNLRAVRYLCAKHYPPFLDSSPCANYCNEKASFTFPCQKTPLKSYLILPQFGLFQNSYPLNRVAFRAKVGISRPTTTNQRALTTLRTSSPYPCLSSDRTVHLSTNRLLHQQKTTTLPGTERAIPSSWSFLGPLATAVRDVVH